MSRQQYENIYNEFRTCEMNKEYYSVRASRIKRKLRNIDIFVAIFGGTTAIASWPLWNVTFLGAQVGAVVFGMFVGLAVLLAVAKPYLKYEDEIERLSGMQFTYAAISFRLKEIVDEIRYKHSISPDADGAIKTLRNVRSAVIGREDQDVDRDLVDAMSDRINARYPKEYFYYPQ